MHIHISFMPIESRLCIRFKSNYKGLVGIRCCRCKTQTIRSYNRIGSLSDRYFFLLRTGYNIQLCRPRFPCLILADRNHNRSFPGRTFCRTDVAPTGIFTTQLGCPLLPGLKTDALRRSSFTKAKTLLKD